jgi:two-component system, chemotaxis family, protein-glutamate methylesterase/glutaminase
MRAILTLVAHGSVSDRAQLTALLRSDPEIVVVGEATCVDQTIALTRRLQPHVLAMGVHLPPGGGLAATRQIMIEAPTPIVVVADDTDALQVEMSMSALRAGALAAIPKPWAPRQGGSGAESLRFLSTIKALSQVKVIHHRYERQTFQVTMPKPKFRNVTPARIVAVAASTGGPAALQQLLSALPANFPAPILVVQHIAQGFVQGLAESLGATCALNVKVAVHGEPLLPQTVFIAPDGNHLGIADRSRILLTNAEPVGGFRPSATHLFESVARVFGPSSAHVILTGMGRDGVAGLAIAHQLGGRVLAQDEASSVVFGMPGEAIVAGVVDTIVPLVSMARELIAMTRG